MMLFDIPDSELSIDLNSLCVENEDRCCPILHCKDCPENILKYKVEGKNPIFQKVYGKYIGKIKTDKKSIKFLSSVSVGEWADIVVDLWGAVVEYMEGKKNNG